MNQYNINGNNNVRDLLDDQKRFSSLDTYIHVLIPFLTAVSALLLKFALLFIMDSDPIWSIGVGEWINTNGKVPYVDVFSWTVAGERWSSNAWLFCWLMYLADQSFGYLGVALLIFIPCLITSYFVYFMCIKYHDSSLSILVFMLGMIFVILFTIAPRSYIYTFPFIAIIMYLIRFKRDSKFIYLIPIVFLIWANMQSSFRFGIAIVFIEALTGTVFFKDKRLWIVVLLSFLATLINPYGFSFWNTSLSGFFIPGNQYITEWRAPDFKNLVVFFLYSFIFITGLLGAFRLKDDINKRVYDRDIIMILFWFWAAFIYSMTTVRAIQYALLLWPPSFTVLVSKFSSGSRNLKPITLVLVIVLFIASLNVSLPLLPLEVNSQSNKPVSFINYLQIKPNLHHSIAELIPYRAVDFLKENPTLLNRLFNSYRFGGYLILNNIDVFIDARESVFTRHNVTEDYFQAVKMEIKPDLIIDKYSINTFLLLRKEPLVFFLEVHPEWEKKYEDDIAVIFTRVIFE